MIVKNLFIAEYKKFDKYSDAQDYLNGKVGMHRAVTKKYPTSKSKRPNNIRNDLIKDTIREYSASAIATSSLRRLTVSDTNVDLDGKYNKRQHVYLYTYCIIFSSSRLVYCRLFRWLLLW